MIKNIIFKISVVLKQRIILRNYTPNKKVFINKNIPYFSQWESKDLVNDIISKKISAKDDPLWKMSGAKTKEEYELWSWNGCGMACLKMILAYKFKKNISLVELGKKCKEYGGYVGKNLDGLYYKPFVKFIKNEFNLNSKIISPMVISDIIKELEKGNFIIASVSYKIRNPNNKISFKGGHLVLIVRYNFEIKIFFIHNPSGIDNKTQAFAKVSFEDFNKSFAYRGIVIYNQ
ncbi:MAG: C39 family peptidase [Candidatus Levybacteria bacterium]|nr:C39 family peptidase [Candidatus Levybacteria bacterium]